MTVCCEGRNVFKKSWCNWKKSQGSLTEDFQKAFSYTWGVELMHPKASNKKKKSVDNQMNGNHRFLWNIFLTIIK